MSTQKKYDVFISSKSEDYPIAERVYDFLVANGLSVFLASKELEKIGKDDYSEAIDDALNVTHHMIVVASSIEHITSEWVKYEWRTFCDDLKSGYREGKLFTILDDKLEKKQLPSSIRHKEAFTIQTYQTKLLSYLADDIIAKQGTEESAHQARVRKEKELQERMAQAEAAKKAIEEQQRLAEQKIREAERKARQAEEKARLIEARRIEEEAKRQTELQKQHRLDEERRLQEEKERKEAEKVARMQEEQRRIREQEEIKRKKIGKLIKVVGCICCIIGFIFWLNPALMIQDPNKLYDKGWNKARKIGTVKGADKDAFQFYRKAAKKGHPAAMNRLALFYMDGVGTKQNIDEAIKWFEEAIEVGNMEAALNLGYLYETGNGVEKDLSQAIKYYKKSAEGGMVRAQLKLGNCYKTGTCGVSQDLKEALKWYQKAADQGNEEAQKLVASLSKKSNSSTKKISSSNSTKVQVKKEDNTKQTTNHELKIYVTPANAVVKVVVEGKEESWSVVNGCATKKIPHGTYYCTVSADGYYPYEKHITFTSSDNSVHINLVKKRSSTSSSSSYTSSNSSSSSSKTSNSLPAKEMHNGHEYVDLGLSVKWATCNLGANDAENYGNHYGWGGDAARTNWGGNWRMPTDMEWIELRNSCTWSWTKKNGVDGYLVKSRKNSNTIFLPAAGYSMKESSGCYSLGVHGYYWSSTMYKNNQNFALGVQFDRTDKMFSRSLDRKNLFCSIRPVFP